MSPDLPELRPRFGAEKISLSPGEWYLLATCEYCHTKHVLARDPFKGKPLPERIYQSTCPDCERISLYVANEIEHYQHP